MNESGALIFKKLDNYMYLCTK